MNETEASRRGGSPNPPLYSGAVLCPSCGDEFREGITACPDCEVALVAELPPEAPPRLSPVERTGDPDRLAVLLETLEGAGVPYVVQAGTALSLLDMEAEPEISRPQEWEARIYVAGNFAHRVAEALAGAEVGRSAEEPEELESLDAADLKKPFEPR